jgi:hypothetical protein
MPKKTKKSFDCVAMKRAAQREIARETKGMTFEQYCEYLRKNVEIGPFAELWKKLTERDKKAAARRARQPLRKTS